jgi:hypothetical protein
MLVGGFAGSPTLKEYLRAKLKQLAAKLRHPIRLLNADAP